MSLFDALADFLFPPRCPHCHAYVEQRGTWCEACLGQVLHPQLLTLYGEAAKVLGDAWAFGEYQGTLRNLILQLKYQKKMHVLPQIRAFVRAGLPSMPQDVLESDIAVPVPLHASKRKSRGFNQVELIFKEELAACGIPSAELLKRTRATKPQYGLKAAARRENIKDAFAWNPSESLACVRGKRVLLLDDILTTGATLADCASVLRKAGARNVVALVLASDRSGMEEDEDEGTHRKGNGPLCR